MKVKVRYVLLVLSVLLVLYFTIFDRHIGTMRMFLSPFWELQHGRWDLIIPNVLLFIPFGIFAGRTWGWRAVLYGAVLSALIEILQFIFGLGYSEVDDVINNTIGAAAGTGMSYLWKEICRKL